MRSRPDSQTYFPVIYLSVLTTLFSAAALHTGIVKVVPPASWKAFEGLRRKYAAVNSGTLDFDLPSPVLQNIMGNKGVYKQYNIEKPSITLQAYKALAELPENIAPAMHERELADPVSALHKKFWCSMGTQASSRMSRTASLRACAHISLNMH